jgi:hypothetical protein
MHDSLEAKYADIQRLSDQRIDELRATPGVSVVGLKERAATATVAELWSGIQVKEYFLTLISARETYDAQKFDVHSQTSSKRAFGLCRLSRLPIAKVLEFRRIYSTFWKYAIAREGTTSQVVKDLSSLIDEAENLKTQTLD